MKQLPTWLLLVGLLHASLAAAEDTREPQWPKHTISDYESFSAYFTAMVPYYERSMDPSLAEEAHAKFGHAAVAVLEPYLKHPSPKVRWHTLVHLWIFAQREPDVPKAQKTVFHLLRAIRNSDDSHDQWIASRLLSISADRYDVEARKLLVGLLGQPDWNHHTLKNLILVAGIIALEEAPALLDQHRAELDWRVCLAMARMGSASDLQSVLVRYDPENASPPAGPNQLFSPRPTLPMPVYLAGLGYTRHPDALEKLAAYAFREDMTPGNGCVADDFLAGRALQTLAPMLKGMPSTWFYTREQITQGRAWLNANYSHEKLPALLTGEAELRPLH